MPTGKGNIRADQLGIGSVLKFHRLIVPPNQREYSWEDEHVQDLLQDFTGAIDSEKPTYFLGTIVLTEGESGHPEVSDGQQRLATTSILLAAIRDYFLEKGEEDLAGSIEKDFLFTYDREARCNVPILTLNVDDRQFFLEAILNRGGAAARKKAKKASHEKIVRAMDLVRAHIQGILKPFKDEHKVDVLLSPA